MDRDFIRQCLPSNEHYIYYPLQVFLNQQKKLGYRSVNLWAAPPHVWMNDHGCEGLDLLERNLDENELKAAVITAEYTTNRFLLNTEDSFRAEYAMRYFENCLCAATILGASMLSITPAGAWRDEDKNRSRKRAAERLKQLCQKAEQHRVTICVNALCKSEGPILNDLQSVGDLVAEVNHPLLTVALDTVALNENGETIEQWLDGFGDRIGLVYLSDARTGKTRYLWGDGILPLGKCMKKIRQSAYHGPFGLRMNAAKYLQDPLEADRRNYKAISECLASEALG